MRVQPFSRLSRALQIFVTGGFFFLSIAQPARAEIVTLYTQPDDSGEMLSQQPTFQETWIASASLGNLFLGKDRLTLTFTMKDPNASDRYGQPAGVALGTCPTCRNLQKYLFTAADRALLADGAFHTFTVQTGTTTLGTADGETPIYITFFGLSQYHNSTHVKSDAAGTIPFLRIEAASPPTLPPVPQAPEGSVTVYEQSDKSGIMTNPQATYQTARIDSASLGNLNLGQDKLYLTFTMKDPMVNNAYRQPEGVAIGTCSGCRNLQTYYFTAADRTLLSDQAFHTFMVETGTTTSTYADGTRPVFISFFNLSQYQYGTKIKSNAAATIPYLIIQKPPPPDPCALPGACASNVLFLPGIEASRLYRPDYAGGTSKLWEPGGDADVRDLFMDESGESIRDDIYTRDVVDEAYGTLNIYKSFLADLADWKSSGVINDYRAVPYDWRVSLDDLLTYGNQFPDGRLYYSGDLRATSTPYIIQELRRLAAGSKTGKVTIVAHSNGGLVAKALIKRLEDTHDPLLDKIDSLIMVAVPQTGTPQAVGALLHGYEQGLPKDWFAPLLSPATAREFASTSPMAYHLLPSASYFSGDGVTVRTPPITFDGGTLTQPFITAYGRAVNDGNELNNFFLGSEGRLQPTRDDLQTPAILSSSLLSYAERAHIVLDDNSVIPASITVHEIGGWGNDTLASIRYYTGTACVRPTTVGTCLQYAPKLQYSPETVLDGDGTVITGSSLAMSTSSPNVRRWWVDLDAHNRIFIFSKPSVFRTSHADILEIPQLRSLIRNLIQQNATSTPQYISNTQPNTTNTKRLIFKLHSPLHLSAHDSLGNEISFSTTTIPGAQYTRFGEVQYISVPADTHPTVELNGYAAGSFTFEVEEKEGDMITATTTFAGVPSTATTQASMTFNDGTIVNALPLIVDEDGDGITDLTIVPVLGGIVLPPKPKLTVTADNKTITLGGSISPLTATVSGFLDEDTTTTSITGIANCTTTATAGSSVGIYPITCSIGTLSSDIYDFGTFASGTLTIRYRWDGFLQPINDTAHQIGQQLSVFKAGSTIPVKLQLKKADGSVVQTAIAPIWLAAQQGSLMSSAVDESVYSDPATSGNTFKWDSTSQQYVYNWSTKGLSAGYWYKVFVKLDDGTIQNVVVGLK